MSDHVNHRRLPQPSQFSRAQLARELENAYLDSLVYHLQNGLDLQGAREMASEAKLAVFAQYFGSFRKGAVQ
jgi:hypothetical protein